MSKGGSIVGEGGGSDEKKGGHGGLAEKLVAKVKFYYYSMLNLSLAFLRWLSTVNPAAIALTLVIGSVLVTKSFRPTVPPQAKPVEIGYSAFLDNIKKGQVAQVQLGHHTLLIELKDGASLMTRVPRSAPPDLVTAMHEKGVVFSQTRPGPGQMIVPYIGLLLYLAVVGYFGWQMLGKGGVSGKVGRKATAGSLDKSLSFQDIAGIDSAKQQVMNLVDVMRNPAKYRRLGARQPTGLLLVGPPGTGKTLLARVVGVELGLPFYYASGSDFVELFVGRGAARIRELFARAEKTSPCIIFIDELDALGKSRGNGMQLVRNDEGEQTLNQLLACMDGIDSKNNGIVVVAATNRYDVLDEALTRPGRFDRVVRVPLPDRDGREKVLRVHARKTQCAADLNFGYLADKTDGFSPAELASIVNEAIITATTRNAERVGIDDFEAVLLNYKTSRGKTSVFDAFVTKPQSTERGFKWKN